MDYYDSNLKNPKVNGNDLIINGEVNKNLALPPSKIVAGKGIKITKSGGKITISLDTGNGNGNT